ncbi:hypothetical protein GOP47_0023654 [Adiantum capillus-veneris]|uniref:Inhibitor I9 domain-containing protein n=1 Tax=Adiantum capillus-veneris TaxID=13818 RepID=A0A9D4Z4N5_ADICA|nr:hypothetical protein GOP47_0023654 [Adiantum capillus-veneris]
MEALAVAVAFLMLIIGVSSALRRRQVQASNSVHEEAEVTSSLNHGLRYCPQWKKGEPFTLWMRPMNQVYRYKHAFRGFSAKLTTEQAAALAGDRLIDSGCQKKLGDRVIRLGRQGLGMGNGGFFFA